MDFLFLCSTPPRCLLWLLHAVRIFVVRWSSELRTTFPINVSCRVAICFLMLVISKKSFLTVSFVICWYFTSSILMPNMRRILQFSNTSSFFRRDVWIAQISYPHSNILMGIARKIRYLLQLSALASVYNLAKDPID